MSSRVRSLNRQIKQFADLGFFERALSVYRAIRAFGAKPDRFTFACVLKSCAGVSAVGEAESVHSLLTKCGFACHLLVGNSLIGSYSDLGLACAARQVFDEMPQRNLVSWNLVISGYGKNGCYQEALDRCASMKNEGVELDSVSLKIILPIIACARALRLGESIHARAVTNGLSRETAVATALADAYSKCGHFQAAEQLFDEIPRKDVVCWNAMITGCSRGGKPASALDLFKQMLLEGFKPSTPTMLLLLQACTATSALQLGRCIHGFAGRLGFSSDVSVSGLLVDMYSKCGELCSAAGVFGEMPEGNVNSWTCMVHGLGMHGYGRGALMVFFRMLKRGILPDGTCFLVLLSSCSHCGLMREGQRVFYYMVSQSGIKPGMEHFATMVDLFGRAGCISEAVGFLSGMEVEPDGSVFGALLSACRVHGDEEKGDVFQRLIGSKWSAAGLYKLLVEMYACKNQWDEVIKIRSLIEEKGLKGTSGCSYIESSICH